MNTLSLCIFSTLFTLFFWNHSIGTIDDFLKIGNKKATDITRLPCCHFYKTIYAQKFVSIVQTVLWIILSIFHYKMIIDFLEIVVLFLLKQFFPHALNQFTQKLPIIHIINQNHFFRTIIRRYLSCELTLFRHSLKFIIASSGLSSFNNNWYKNCFSLSGLSKNLCTEIFGSANIIKTWFSSEISTEILVSTNIFFFVLETKFLKFQFLRQYILS